MKPQEVRAAEVRVGMTMTVGTIQKPKPFLVSKIESHPEHYRQGIIFYNAEGKRIYRWDDNLEAVSVSSTEKGN